MDNTFNGQQPNNNMTYDQQPMQTNQQPFSGQQFQGISSQPIAPPAGQPQKKNTLIYVIVAIVAVIIVLILGVLIGKGMAPDNGTTTAPTTNGQTTSTDTTTTPANSGAGSPVAILDAKELKDTYDNVNFKQYIGKKITITNVMAYINDDGSISLSPGLLSFFSVSCDNAQALGLVSSEWYTITGVLDSSTVLASSYHLSNCTAVKQ